MTTTSADAHREILDSITAACARPGFEMSCEPDTGALLRTLAAARPAARLLELGTGAGIGTSRLLTRR